jgi:hypothetical protein
VGIPWLVSIVSLLDSYSVKNTTLEFLKKHIIRNDTVLKVYNHGRVSVVTKAQAPGITLLTRKANVSIALKASLIISLSLYP